MAKPEATSGSGAYMCCYTQLWRKSVLWLQMMCVCFFLLYT